jgi:hypothetical protein
MGVKSPRFKIWDRQACAYVKNSSSLHCFSNWVVDAFSGEIYDFVGVIDGQSRESSYTLSTNPEYYASGKKIINKKRYVLVQCTGLKDSKGKMIYERDVLVSASSNPHKYVCVWSPKKAAFVLKENGKKTALPLGQLASRIEVIGAKL